MAGSGRTAAAVALLGTTAAAAAALAIVGAWVASARASAGAAAGGKGGGGKDAAPPPDDDARLQEEILALWFGGGDVESNYRHKWFCAPGSPRQREFDAEVYNRFAPLLLALNSDAPRAARWQSTPRGLLVLIVLFDQLARHIYRHIDSSTTPPPPFFPLTKPATDARALEFAQELESRGWIDIIDGGGGNGSGELVVAAAATGSEVVGGGLATRQQYQYHAFPLSAPEFVFALMPWRHSPTVDRLRHVLARVDARLALEEQHKALLLRFRKTTLRKLQELEDRARAAADDDILEHHPFHPSDEAMKALPQHAVTLAVKEYLEACVKGRGYPALAVSLSGGVDSMVIARLLRHFAPDYGNPAIVALHIDYANREESGKEAGYVEKWCGEWGIVFRKRVVGEVTRGVTARDEYEKVARDIRFGFYKEAIHEFGCPAILLGHHQGDVQENVLSNAMRGVGPLHLSGMTQTSIVNGVAIHRPLLPLEKDAIFDFAHRFGVPYFKDTTPTWSTRGKLRRQLLPLLMDVYGEGVTHNLARLAAESDELRALVSQRIFEPFWQSVHHAPLAAYVDCADYREQSPFFWREALRALLHAQGQAMLTDKGVALLIRRLEEMEAAARGNKGSQKEPEVWCQLRKEYATLLYGHGPRLFLFKPGAIRDWDQRPSAKKAEVALDVHLATLSLAPFAAGAQTTTPTRMGAWDVSTQLTDTEGGFEELASLEAFCRGAFGYSLTLGPCDGCGALPVLRVRQEGGGGAVGGKRGYRGLGSCLQALPLKVKRSIPLLVPACPRCDALASNGSTVDPQPEHEQSPQGSAVVVRVCYRFVEVGRV